MADTNVRISVESRDTARLAAAVVKVSIKKFVEDAIETTAKPIMEKLHERKIEQEKS